MYTCTPETSSLFIKTNRLFSLSQLKRQVDVAKLELTMHTLVCGRTRKNIKMIEAATDTAIYFPPPFPRVFGYIPPGATRRSDDEVYITGHSQEHINEAKAKLRDLVLGVKVFVKDVVVTPSKIDSILLERLDKVQKVMETNGSYVLFPQLGSQRNTIRVQGTEVLHVERTIREIMALVGVCLLYSHIIYQVGYRLTCVTIDWPVLRRFLVDHGT